MKITKRVEECIREQLWEKASTAYHLDELNKEREAAVDAWEEHCKQIKERVDAELKDYALSRG